MKCPGIPMGRATVKIQAGKYSKSEVIQVYPRQLSQIKFEDPSKIDELLKKADNYFKKRWFTSPKRRNAFNIYQKVLKLKPENTYAQEKIRAIRQFYKSRAESYHKKNRCAKTRTYCDKYLVVARYESDILGNQDIKQEIQEIQDLLENIRCPRSSKKKQEAVKKPRPTTEELIKDSLGPVLEGL
ncbi:hypothetical protein QUF80_19775 [Desulfococcaceae bacterium HSG8]|nr:hypothetical protein [Desulfococcaceae bacterium HSG8]